jgi:hypothetical protein
MFHEITRGVPNPRLARVGEAAPAAPKTRTVSPVTFAVPHG